MSRHPYGQTVAFQRVPLDDRRQPTGEPPQVFELRGCVIESVATIEQSRSHGGVPTDDNRDTVISTKKVHLPPDSGVQVTDRAWLPGENRAHRPMWRLTAQPDQQRNPFTGHYPGDVIQIERVDG